MTNIKIKQKKPVLLSLSIALVAMGTVLTHPLSVNMQETSNSEVSTVTEIGNYMNMYGMIEQEVQRTPIEPMSMESQTILLTNGGSIVNSQKTPISPVVNLPWLTKELTANEFFYYQFTQTGQSLDYTNLVYDEATTNFGLQLSDMIPQFQERMNEAIATNDFTMLEAYAPELTAMFILNDYPDVPVNIRFETPIEFAVGAPLENRMVAIYGAYPEFYDAEKNETPFTFKLPQEARVFVSTEMFNGNPKENNLILPADVAEEYYLLYRSLGTNGNHTFIVIKPVRVVAGY